VCTCACISERLLTCLRKWNTSLIDQALLDRFTTLTGHKPHRWLRRGLYFSHRDFSKILDCYEYGEKFFLYTGRGPSSDSMHIGHTIPFEFTKWLQDVFDVPLVIMLTDDEKAIFKDGLTLEAVMQFSRDNAKDILAMGFDKKKTFIYSDLKYTGGHFLLNAWEFSKLVNFNQVRGAFGFNERSVHGRGTRGLVLTCEDTVPTLGASSSQAFSALRRLQRHILTSGATTPIRTIDKRRRPRYSA
jgi:tryptophanyl-tRNA synthetase